MKSITVNVRLCGGVPRNEMKQVNNNTSLAAATKQAFLQEPLLTKRITTVDALDGIIRHSEAARRLDVGPQPLGQVFEPPAWACKATGETRLEPVCETEQRHASIDLTTQSSYQVGRSPAMDLQLMHATSSRRHAMIFHHSNGSCYVIDCGSAHGTYVNGRRVPSPGAGGQVVPYKVRNGAMIRFGGPGAPCFVLKSFTWGLNEINDEELSDEGKLAARNARLNALGKSASASIGSKVGAALDFALTVARKRSFDSLASTETLDLENEPCNKRMRCDSPPLSPDEPLRLVSPDFSALMTSKPRRVRFSKDPPQMYFPALVTPEDLSDNDSV